MSGSQPGPRDHREREARQRVLEEILLRPVVEEVLGLEVEPERPRRAYARAGVEQQARGQRGGAELVARHRRDRVDLGVTFEALAAVRAAEKEPVRRAIGQRLVALGLAVGAAGGSS